MFIFFDKGTNVIRVVNFTHFFINLYWIDPHSMVTEAEASFSEYVP